MKIKVTTKSLQEVNNIPPCKIPTPKRPSILLRTLVKVASAPDLKKTNFSYTTEGMEKLGKNEPCLILMNHSAFVDLEIASTILYPRPFQIVCTLDGFVGKQGLMRNLGCIPTRKFLTDLNLVKAMNYAFKTLKTSVLMYPEASYSFDGTATPLPESLAKCIKILKVPVVMIRTYGAFLRDPLYNGLRLRDTTVTAKMSYVLSPDEIATKKTSEIAQILTDLFTFDNFKLQQESGTKITEDFRAEGLDRVLYKCPHCLREDSMQAHGIQIRCTACGKGYTLTEDGFLAVDSNSCSAEASSHATGNNATPESNTFSTDSSPVMAGSETPTDEINAFAAKGNNAPAFTHIPDWYAWERECVKEELKNKTYLIDTPVDICVLRDLRSIYRVGEGRLVHNEDGFKLTGCDGALDYSQAPLASYSLYSDYFWYELGDMICIGNEEMLYYCFPKGGFKNVAKARLATEELYKMKKAELKANATVTGEKAP